MLRIEPLNEKNYVLKLTRFIDREEFIEINDELKSIYCFYNPQNKGWSLPINKVLDVYDYVSQKLRLKIELQENIVLPKSNSLNLEDTKTKFFRASTFNENVLRVKLFDYQKEDVLWLLKRNRGLIASDPGVGKTIESIATFSELKSKNKIDSVFIIVKNNLTYHWYREILEYSSLYEEKDILIITNKNKKTFFNSSEIPEIIICPNHILKDVVQNLPDTLKKTLNKNNICLVIDECHEFKNTKAKKTQSLFSVLQDFEYRYLLSATPAINAFEDWYSQITILDNSVIPMSENRFKTDIAKSMGTDYDAYKITSYKPERLKHYIEVFKPWVIKRIKSELPEMKTKQFVKPIYLQMSDTHIKLYNTIRDVYIKKAKEEGGKIQYKDIENKYPYLMMVIDNPSLLTSKIKEESDTAFKILDTMLKKWQLEDYEKLEYLDDFLEQKIQIENEKVIVFDTHPLTLNQLSERYKSYNPLMIHGQLNLSNEQRQEIIDKFNDSNSKHKLILLNVQTGGTGLNLQKSCNTIIYYNLPYDTVLYRQSLDRTHRISSTRDSFVEILCYGKSFDEIRMKKNLKRVYDNDYLFKNDNEEILI